MEITIVQACIDSFFFLLCLGIICSAISKGLLSEIFKLSGLLVSSALAFQFYLCISEKIQGRIFFLSKHYFYFFSFLSIFTSILIIFRLARFIVTFLIKKSDMRCAGKWLLFFLGIFRATFFSSVLIFLFLLAPFDSDYVVNTFSYKIFNAIAPQIYLKSFSVYKRLNPESSLEINKHAEDYQKRGFKEDQI